MNNDALIFVEGITYVQDICMVEEHIQCIYSLSIQYESKISYYLHFEKCICTWSRGTTCIS